MCVFPFDTETMLEIVLSVFRIGEKNMKSHTGIMSPFLKTGISQRTDTRRSMVRGSAGRDRTHRGSLYHRGPPSLPPADLPQSRGAWRPGSGCHSRNDGSSRGSTPLAPGHCAVCCGHTRRLIPSLRTGSPARSLTTGDPVTPSSGWPTRPCRMQRPQWKTARC